jgi:hypothetical protein
MLKISSFFFLTIQFSIKFLGKLILHLKPQTDKPWEYSDLMGTKMTREARQTLLNPGLRISSSTNVWKPFAGTSGFTSENGLTVVQMERLSAGNSWQHLTQRQFSASISWYYCYLIMKKSPKVWWNLIGLLGIQRISGMGENWKL